MITYLRPYKENVYIKLDEFGRKADKKFIKYSLSQIKKYFNVKIIKINRNRYNNHYYICSREFAKFVRENTKSKYLWPKISDIKIKRLVKKWELIHK